MSHYTPSFIFVSPVWLVLYHHVYLMVLHIYQTKPYHGRVSNRIPLNPMFFSMKYPPQNSCLHMLTLWNPSKCWCFGTLCSPWKTAMARGYTLFSIDKSGPTMSHQGGDRSLWNCHMTRGESSSIHQKKMGKVLTMWGLPVTSCFKNIPWKL